jgi:membrane protein required for colicin V production
MNQVDALLVVLLVPFALRGYVRGFCRESVGLAGLVGGALAAAAGGSALSAALIARHLMPPLIAEIVAFAGIFIAVNLLAYLLGLLVDRLARAVFLGGVNRVAGIAFGVAKGAAFLGFVLLVVQEVVPVPAVVETIAKSRLGRPLTTLATDIVAVGRSFAGGHRAAEQPA